MDFFMFQFSFLPKQGKYEFFNILNFSLLLLLNSSEIQKTKENCEKNALIKIRLKYFFLIRCRHTKTT